MEVEEARDSLHPACARPCLTDAGGRAPGLDRGHRRPGQAAGGRLGGGGAPGEVQKRSLIRAERSVASMVPSQLTSAPGGRRAEPAG